MYNNNLEVVKVNQYIQKHKKEFSEEIGATIRNYRKKQNISINSLAERSMMTSAYISQIEKGNNGLSLAKFIMICNSLEVEPNKLLENVIFGGKENDDLIYNELQKEKNLSKNILEFMKQKSNK